MQQETVQGAEAAQRELQIARAPSHELGELVARSAHAQAGELVCVWQAVVEAQNDRAHRWQRRTERLPRQGAQAVVAGVRVQAEQGPYVPGEQVPPTGGAEEASVLQSEAGEGVVEPTALALMERKVNGEPEAEDLEVRERNHLAPKEVGGVEAQEAQKELLELPAQARREVLC